MNPTAAFNPRGTSGSGKTTIVRAILDVSGAVPCEYHGKKVRMYRGEFQGSDLYVLGDYRGICGGCDTIQPFADILPLITYVMNKTVPSILVYEGLLISHSIGSIGDLVKPYGQRHVMGFLDTPLEVCLERVKGRRLERGQLAPLNPENTTKDHASVARCHARASQQGFHTVSINHEDAISQSLGILHGLSEVINPAVLDPRARQHSG
jgi:hypothetical protein